ncbi:hypothetical protein HK405_000144, partial [Cladochytrium tenue]
MPSPALTVALGSGSSGGSAALARTAPSSSLHPSQVYLAPRPPQQVLDEDAYVGAVSSIIQRDFFPDLARLRTQNDFLDAVST